MNFSKKPVLILREKEEKMGGQCKDSLNVRPSSQMSEGEKIIKLKTLSSFVPGHKVKDISSFKISIKPYEN